MPKVVNRHHLPGKRIPAGAVDIGRPGPWGNPYEIGADGTREDVVAKHARWLADQTHLLRRLSELSKADSLVCYCHPSKCHGDLLAWLADASREQRIAWWEQMRAMPAAPEPARLQRAEARRPQGEFGRSRRFPDAKR